MPGHDQVAIVSKAAATASTDDFNTGKARSARVRQARPLREGLSIELARNDEYWAAIPRGQSALRLLPQDASRVAELLSVTCRSSRRCRLGRRGVRKDSACSLPHRCRPVIYLNGQRSRRVPVRADRRVSPPKNPLRILACASDPKAINGGDCSKRDGGRAAGWTALPEFLFGARKNLKFAAYDRGARKSCHGRHRWLSCSPSTRPQPLWSTTPKSRTRLAQRMRAS